MSKTVSQSGYVAYSASRARHPSVWPHPFVFFDYKPDENSSDYILVSEVEISYEVPDDFDPRPEQVKALERQKQELQAQFSAAVMKINRQISELTAIEFDGGKE